MLNLKDYEKEAFVFLGLAFMWVIYWAIGTWIMMEWFELLVAQGFSMWIGVLMFAGVIYLAGYALITLMVGQFKDFWKHLKEKIDK